MVRSCDLVCKPQQIPSTSAASTPPEKKKRIVIAYRQFGRPFHEIYVAKHSKPLLPVGNFLWYYITPSANVDMV